jgi:hypothetical protein
MKSNAKTFLKRTELLESNPRVYSHIDSQQKKKTQNNLKR